MKEWKKGCFLWNTVQNSNLHPMKVASSHQKESLDPNTESDHHQNPNGHFGQSLSPQM